MWSNQFAVLLRIIGEFLDAQLAVRATIAIDEHRIALHWHTLSRAVKQCYYSPNDLAKLVPLVGQPGLSAATTQSFTERLSPALGTSRGERFANLGQQLYEDRIEVIGITEAATGLRVLGSRRGEYIDLFFPAEQREEAS